MELRRLWQTVISIFQFVIRLCTYPFLWLDGMVERIRCFLKPKGVANRLTEHLINTVILTLFFLSTLLVCIITMARVWDWMDAVNYCMVLLDIFLSLELADLLYHIFRLILIDNLPSQEIAQILKNIQRIG